MIYGPIRGIIEMAGRRKTPLRAAFERNLQSGKLLFVFLTVPLYFAGCQSAPIAADSTDRKLVSVKDFMLEPPNAESSPALNLKAFRTDHQKPVLFDSFERLDYLKNEPLRENNCSTPFSSKPVKIFAKVLGHDWNELLKGKTTKQKSYLPSNEGVPFPKWVSQGFSEWLATGETRHLRRLSNELVRWADGGGITSVIPDKDHMQYVDTLAHLREILTAPIIAYDVLRRHGILKGAELQRVSQWLNNAVKMTDRWGVEDDDTWVQRDSHVIIHRGFVFILWGAASGKDVFFRKGFQEYLDQLSRLRSDGSTHYDVSPAKGKRSLLKQNQVVAFLVMSAEIAANQGYDLYGLKYRGVSVHHAIKFLLDAAEDESLVSFYSKVKKHNLIFINRWPSKLSNNLAWAEPYIARFRGTSLANRLNQYVMPSRPALGVTYGGNLTCMFAKTFTKFGKNQSRSNTH